MSTTLGSPGPPPARSESFDLMRALRILFDDPDWVKKTLFGSLFVLLAMLFIGIFFLAGYGVRLLRNAARGDSQPLPEWDDLGGLFQDGLAPVGAYLVYALGAMLVPASIGCVVGLAAGGLGSIGSSEAGETAAALGAVVFYLLMMVVGLAMLAFFPAAFTRMVLEDRFSAVFEFGEIFAYIKRNPGNYLLAVLAYFIASMISQFGILLLCVGIFPAVFWSYVVMAWGLGEAARLDPRR
jgi:hypothetical protein